MPERAVCSDGWTEREVRTRRRDCCRCCVGSRRVPRCRWRYFDQRHGAVGRRNEYFTDNDRGTAGNYPAIDCRIDERGERVPRRWAVSDRAGVRDNR